MNRADREGVKRARLDTRTDVVADGAVLWYGFDVLNRGVWSIVGAHESVMRHLRARVALP
jgi:hypothetical protein